MADVAVTSGEDLLGDQRLFKHVLTAGERPPPAPGSVVSVHYTCSVPSSAGQGCSTIVDDSRGRGRPFTFTLGQDEVNAGLERAVASMAVGEHARFAVHSDLVYGAAGCGGGAVPGCGMLDFAVELLEVREPASHNDACGAAGSAEERLQWALRAKDRGNVDFKAGTLECAAQTYEAALRLLGCIDADPEVDDGSWQDAALREERDKVAVSCFLNLAQCELKLERFLEAQSHASAALALDPANSKAIYRRGLAHMAMGLWEQARADLVEAVRREPRNSEVRVQLQECQKRCQASEQLERHTFGGMFGRGSLYEERASGGGGT